MSSKETPPASTLAPPSHPFVTANDHSSLLNVVGWFSVVVIALVVLTRLGTRWAFSRTFGFDDVAIITSAMFSIAQTTTVSLGVPNGLGRSTGDESESQLIAQQKSIYAFTILFVFGQFFAKLSIICFVLALTPYRTHRTISWVLTAASCIWMLISVFGFAFECSFPEPWKFMRNECINRVAFYTFVEIFNIVLDSALALLPSFIIAGLQVATRRKCVTISFFMTRFLVVAASLAQLAVIYSRDEDPFLSWTFALLLTIIQTLGIVTACGLYLKPFLDSVNVGMIGNDDIRRRNEGAVNSYGRSTDSNEVRGSKTTSKISRKASQKFTHSRSHYTESSQYDEERELYTIATPIDHKEAHVSPAHSQDGEEWEIGSQSSRARIMRKMTPLSSESCE